MKPLANNEIFGSWATLLLAYDENGNIDYSRLSDEIDVLIASNPNGIYSNGTAGEFYAQSEEEFLKISELLAVKCEQAGLPFQIGVSHMSPQISLERLKKIKHLSPGAIQVILPDWFPVNIEESVSFLKKMAEEAEKINIVLYNPPHAKKVLSPDEWQILKQQIPGLVGLKVSDNNSNKEWYEKMNINKTGLSIFIPGHNLATGIMNGAHGTYSNMACLNPFTAQKWYKQIISDPDSALELERRINLFMREIIVPYIIRFRYSNHACDRFMALMGGWANIGSKMRWPYQSIPFDLVETERTRAKKIIPEFFAKN